MGQIFEGWPNKGQPNKGQKIWPEIKELTIFENSMQPAATYFWRDLLLKMLP